MNEKNFIKRYFLGFVDPTNAAVLGFFLVIVIMALVAMTISAISSPLSGEVFILLLVIPGLISGAVHYWVCDKYITGLYDFKDADCLIVKNPDGTNSIGRRVWAKIN